jgi:hypothetical protein
MLRADDEHAQTFGEACVVTGRYFYQQGGMAAENRFLRILVRRGKQWTLLLHHATHIGEPATSFWASPIDRKAMQQAQFADAEGKFLQDMGPLIAKALIDADAREQIHARDYRFQNWRGAVSTREQMISQLRTGIQQVGQRTPDEEQVRLAGDLAIYSPRLSQPGGRIAGQPRPELVRLTGVYVKRDGRWQDIMAQVSPVLIASAPPDFTLSP